MRWKIRYYFFSSLVILSLLVVGLIGGFVNKAYAITYGEPDGNEHPYVGIVAIYNSLGKFVGSGTCTLVSSQVVLTAGHITSMAEWYGYLQISFESDLSQFEVPPDYGDAYWERPLCRTGTPHTHPDYWDDWRYFPNTYDVGVIILDEPVPVEDISNYGELPPLGALDALATKRGRQEQIFTTVGYGIQSIRPFYQQQAIRYKATSMLVNLRSALTDGYNLHTSNNPGKGQGTGGSCRGDSGGPVFLDDTNIIAAVVSFGLNENCKGADFGYRMDITESQEFINSYLD